MRKYVSAVRISIHHGIRSRKRVGGGRLEGSYVPPKEPRVLRGLTRYRVKLVEHQNISPPSRAGYRNYLNDATSSWLPLPATFWASVVRAMPHGQCRRIVSRRPSDACSRCWWKHLPDVRQCIACYHQKGRTFSYSRLLLHDPSKPGASASRICSRARHSLVFTFASDRPRACAVSLILRCCTSRKIITTRYFSARESRALVSAFRSSTCSKASDGISRQSAKSFGM